MKTAGLFLCLFGGWFYVLSGALQKMAARNFQRCYRAASHIRYAVPGCSGGPDCPCLFIFRPQRHRQTSMAKIMAKAVNCEKGPSSEPCNQCRTCREINEGISLDVYEIDAASNRGIEEIRSLKESVQNLPSSCRKKVYIIDEVHMLTKEAFNALLKTLEEPPSHVLFILATTEPEKFP